MTDFQAIVTTALEDKMAVSELLGEFNGNPDTVLDAVASNIVEVINERLLNDEKMFHELFSDELPSTLVRRLIAIVYMKVGLKLLEES